MRSLSFRSLFSLLFVLFVGLLASSALSAWTGPTAPAPGGNVTAPINAGSTDQVKNGGLSVNAFTVFGSAYIQNSLGIGTTRPAVALDVNGTIKIGNAGELCQQVSAGAMRYDSSSNVMEYCNGTAWTQFGTQNTSVTPGYAFYSTPGTYTFPVPAQFNNLTVMLLAGGGGGGGPNGGGGRCNARGQSGSSGADSSFNQSVVASGGGGGQGGYDSYFGSVSPGTPGSGSGGTVTVGGGSAGGAGGASSCDGGTGGTGGSGGETVQTFTPATLTSTSVSVVVGGGGAGGGNDGLIRSSGAAGSNGLVMIFWQ